ncbi:MAG TPA: helix-turn-helix domain-containing protein, partial [Symbiobacteriaceae bacterium]|nr:helix-turn-helix domain-containing protein [Symbiobacteriaceae bacterium]
MEEIGRRLRAAREARGITLEVTEDETKIRRKYIEALEAGQEAGLPGDAYLKGFLRTYGNYLGLDGTALVDEYKQHKEQSHPEHPPERAAAPREQRAPSAPASRTEAPPRTQAGRETAR